jgi:hypothetical protein
MLDRLGAKLAQWAGLTGRERYTTGETLWIVALSLALGLTVGMMLVIVTGGLKC